MTDIVAFLTARLDEDERIARAAAGRDPLWWDTGPGYPEAPEVRVVNDRDDVVVAETGELEAVHIAHHDPTRVQREVAAKRAIVAAHETFGLRVATATYKGYDALNYHRDQGTLGALQGVLRYLAAVYDDHPDYDPAWRPE